MLALLAVTSAKDRGGHGKGAGAPELAAFVTSHFVRQHAGSDRTDAQARAGARISACQPQSCALLHWLRQTRELASLVSAHSGERMSVQIFTECLEPAWGPMLSQRPRVVSASAPSVRVVIHPTHGAKIREAVRRLQERARRMRCCFDQTTPMVETLHKWEVLSLTRARVAVFVDLDVELLPQRSLALADPSATAAALERAAAPARRVATEWAALLRCASSSNYSLLATPDHSSPVNAAIMLLRPDAALFREGIEVLHAAAATPFDNELGWGRVGKPSVSLPLTDHAWYRRPGHMEMLDKDTWRFVGAQIDQGFFFYMTRVIHTSGADTRLSACARDPAGPGVDDAAFYHYGAHGGRKPEAAAQAWSQAWRGRRGGQGGQCEAVVSSAVGKGKSVQLEGLRRAFGWTRRAHAEMRAMASELDAASRVPTPLPPTAAHIRARALNDTEVEALSAQLRRCEGVIDGAVRCVHHGAAAWRNSSARRAPGTPARALDAERAQLRSVLHSFSGPGGLPRAIPIAQRAQLSGRWAAYMSPPRRPPGRGARL